MTDSLAEAFVTAALQWFAVGVLWLFIAGVLLGLVGFIRRVLG